MIASTKNASHLETVRRNGPAAAREKTLQSQADLSDQVEALNQLAQVLADAVKSLVVAAEALVLAKVSDIELGIDFYAEMQRYELLLIQRALKQTKGSQVKAAALLKVSPTTLNSKIKLFAGRAGQANERTARFSLLS